MKLNLITVLTSAMIAGAKAVAVYGQPNGEELTSHTKNETPMASKQMPIAKR